MSFPSSAGSSMEPTISASSSEDISSRMAFCRSSGRSRRRLYLSSSSSSSMMSAIMESGRRYKSRALSRSSFSLRKSSRISAGWMCSSSSARRLSLPERRRPRSFFLSSSSSSLKISSSVLLIGHTPVFISLHSQTRKGGGTFRLPRPLSQSSMESRSLPTASVLSVMGTQ